jgi:hypothetical protein
MCLPAREGPATALGIVEASLGYVDGAGADATSRVTTLAVVAS